MSVSLTKIVSQNPDSTVEVIHTSEDPTSWRVRQYRKKFGIKFHLREYRFIDGQQAAQFAVDLQRGPLVVE
jgi:hypothetical protein